ncbi:hypothetical protein FOCC_FOCC011408, partial [Frankliniella occidentalis]
VHDGRLLPGHARPHVGVAARVRHQLRHHGHHQRRLHRVRLGRGAVVGRPRRPAAQRRGAAVHRRPQDRQQERVGVDGHVRAPRPRRSHRLATCFSSLQDCRDLWLETERQRRRRRPRLGLCDTQILISRYDIRQVSSIASIHRGSLLSTYRGVSMVSKHDIGVYRAFDALKYPRYSTYRGISCLRYADIPTIRLDTIDIIEPRYRYVDIGSISKPSIST